MASKAERSIDHATEAFRAYGYVVMSEPLTGSEDVYAAALWDGVRKVEATFNFNAKRYGFRGYSKAAISALHARLPNPAFGVEALCLA